MTQIITVTPSPAIDASTSVAAIEPFKKLRCVAPRRDPGGGGINVARVVHRLGGEVMAVFPSGGATGKLLERLINRENIASVSIPIAEETREDFTVFEEKTSRQYRFVMPGAALNEGEWRACIDHVQSQTVPPEFLVASGSLPDGVPEGFFAQLARVAKRSNTKVAIDTSGAALRAALNEGVYLIKPNLREFQELTGEHSSEEPALIKAARDIIARNGARIVALSLGPNGALLIDRDQAIRAEGIPIKPASVVGAGDSFLGAMIWSLANRQELSTVLRYAVAAGTSALLRPGTELCLLEEVVELVQSVKVRPI